MQVKLVDEGRVCLKLSRNKIGTRKRDTIQNLQIRIACYAGYYEGEFEGQNPKWNDKKLL